MTDEDPSSDREVEPAPAPLAVDRTSEPPPESTAPPAAATAKKKKAPREPAPSEPTKTRSPVIELVIGAAVLLGIRAGLELLDGLLASAPLASVVIGALVVDVVAGRAGLMWSESDESAGAQARRAGAGAVIGLVVFALLALVGVGLGWAHVSPGHPDGMVLLTLVGAGATSVRDELLFRGLPLMYAARAGLAPRWAVLFAAALSPAFIASDPAAGAGSLALAFAAGLAFASIYRSAGGATAAIGAHAAWLFAVGPLARGILEIGWSRGDLGDGTAASGGPAFVGAAIFTVAAIATPALAKRFGLAASSGSAKAAASDEASPVSRRKPRPARSGKAPSRSSRPSP